MRLFALFMAGYLFLGSLFPGTDFSQLARVVHVEHHYQTHLLEAGLTSSEFSFWAFLKMHYLAPDEHQGEHESDHQQLPYQSVSSPVLLLITPHTLLSLPAPPHPAALRPAFANRLHLRGFTRSVFIPPSFAG